MCLSAKSVSDTKLERVADTPEGLAPVQLDREKPHQIQQGQVQGPAPREE